MAPIKVGIIGYGFSTKCFHLPFILPNPDLEVHAFLQRRPPPQTLDDAKSFKWGHCTIDFPKVKHYQNSEEFFQDPETELVIVLTGDGTHLEFVEGALNAGKHVVVEKPFVNTSAEADRCIALAKEQGRLLTVYHNRRYDGDFRTLQHLVNEGALGEILDAELHFDHPDAGWIHGWTSNKYIPGQGMMFGLGTHTLDQALVLFGKPASVTGFLRANRGAESEIDDTFTIILQYDSKLVVTVKTAVVTKMKDQLKFWVRGTNGTYIKFGTDPQEAKAVAAPGQPATDPTYGAEEERLWGTLTTTTEYDTKHQTFDEATGHYTGQLPTSPGWYRGYYENVVAAVRGEAQVTVPAESARDGLRIIELARQSHEEGRTVKWS